LGSRQARAALPKMKITRVRYYRSPNQRPIFNQSFNVIVVETSQGITGIGEGGSKDTVEHYGDRWDANEPIENRWIDYSRVTMPNVGGVTEFIKLAALCETHYVGLIPHFTGPIATAALVHCRGASSGPVLMEMTGKGATAQPHLPHHFDFRKGKLWPNERLGLGVEFDASKAELIADITEHSRPTPLYNRPDESVTNW